MHEPVFAAQPPGRATSPAGSVQAADTVVAAAPLLTNEDAPVTVLPGPVQASGSESAKPARLTPTEKLHVDMLFEASVALQLTVVTPTGKTEPEGGVQTAVTPGQLSETAGAGKLTTAELPVVATVWFAGQVIAGACVSVIVTVKLTDGPWSALQVTVVVPTGKKDPEGGEQVTAPQSPVTMVGGGYATEAPH
jgi:hypothetical protein